MPLSIGDVLKNRYRVIGLIAVGGFGAVYRAEDHNLMNKPCAVKENLETKQAAQQAFLQEAKLLAGLNHPNLPRVTDYFLDGQNQYLVMDLVEGEDLQDMVDRLGPMPEQNALYWMNQVFDALTYLHSQQSPIIHRDIKPANIKITPHGQAMLVDFGIAKTYAAGSKTQPGARGVSPGYSPVEQYGQGNTDQRTDIYALGATLYTMLTGREPVESIQRSHGTRMTPISQVNPGVRPCVQAAIQQAMELHPDHRFYSVADFRTSLNDPVFQHTPGVSPYQGMTRQVSGGSSSSAASATWAPTAVVSPPLSSPTAQRNPGWLWPAIIAGVIVMCLVFGFGGRWAYISITGEKATPTDRLVVDTQPTATLRPSITPGPADTATNLPPSSTPVPPREPTLPITPGATMISPKDEAVMVFVPAGEFLMGSKNSDSDSEVDEMPQHLVALDDYWIDQKEVTYAMFQKFVQANGNYQTNMERKVTPVIWDIHTGTRNKNDENKAIREGKSWKCPRGNKQGCNPSSDDPVVWISWDEAQKYCEWAGRRLPSEAEWEKAARGTGGLIYPWGESVDNGDRMNFADLSRCRQDPSSCDWADRVIDDKSFNLASVGSYPQGRSPYGALDMAGNVWEWVEDSYGEFFYDSAESRQKNPINREDTKKHVLRGGSYLDEKKEARTANRYGKFPQDITDVHVGFRCAMDAPGPAAQSQQGGMSQNSLARLLNSRISSELVFPTMFVALVVLSPLARVKKKLIKFDRHHKRTSL
jgi:formylglycine-generating enzyme required for sulfatase activity